MHKTCRDDSQCFPKRLHLTTKMSNYIKGMQPKDRKGSLHAAE